MLSPRANYEIVGNGSPISGFVEAEGNGDDDVVIGCAQALAATVVFVRLRVSFVLPPFSPAQSVQHIVQVAVQFLVSGGDVLPTFLSHVDFAAITITDDPPSHPAFPLTVIISHPSSKIKPAKPLSISGRQGSSDGSLWDCLSRWPFWW